MNRKFKDYIFARWLTKQERLVIQTVLALLLIGWAVKNYRLMHPLASPNSIVEETEK